MRKTILKTVCFLAILFTFGAIFETSAVCDHSFTLLTHSEPACTREGKDSYICRCGEVYTVSLSAKGHSFVLTSETEATHENEGGKVYTCSVCGESYTETTDALTLSEVKGVKVVSYCDSEVKIGWNSTEGARAYEVYCKIAGGQWQTSTTDKLTFTFKDLEGASLYFFRVRALCGENTGQWSETVSRYTKPTAVRVEDITAGTSSMTFSWIKSEGASGYQILYSTDKSFKKYKKMTVNGGDTTEKTISSLSPATVYYIKIRPCLTADSENIYGAFSNTAATVTAPIAVSVTSVSSTENSVTVNWQKVKGATGYYLEYSSSGNFASAEKIKTSSLKHTLEKLTPCRTYYFRVRAYKTFESESYFGDYSNVQSVTVKPAQVKFTSLLRGSEKVTAKWKTSENVSGYEIKYSQKKDFSSANKITVSGESSCKKTVTSLKSATSYYFKIRAYKTVDGEKIYGKYSTAKRVTTSPAKVKTESIKAGEGKLAVTWEKVSRADFYQVVYSTSENFKNSKSVTVKASQGTKKTLKNLSKAKVYYVKVRACKVVGSTKIYGEYSNTLKVRTKLGTVKLQSAVAGTNSISLSWNKVASADGYEIFYGTYSSFSDGKTVKLKGESNVKNTIKNLASAKTYYIKVRAYKVRNNKKVYAEYSERLKITTLPQKVNVAKTEKKNATSLKLYWNEAENVSGYEVEYSLSSNFAKSVKVTVSGKATTSRLIKELKRGKAYYFRVRAYKTVDGRKVYGGYGQVKSAKI